MIYLLKLLACSALFLLVYLFLLQREKMFGFNRAFLLAGLILPLFIPYITFEASPILPSEAVRLPEAREWVRTFPTASSIVGQSSSELTRPEAAKAPLDYLLITYLVITCMLLFRFVLNLLSIVRNIRSHEHVPFRDHTLVLLDQPVSPHSFMRYILVHKKDWQENRIEKEILHHEYLHGKLHHSADILLVELFQVFCWFNPVLYFYKRAIRLNHEYQVDAQVLKHFNNAPRYQQLLLKQAVMPARGLSHSFNFIHLKKRIRMISAKPHPLLITLKIALTVIFTGGLVFLFGEKTFAQQPANKTLPAQRTNATSAKTDPEEFDKLASKVLTHSVKGKEYRFTSAETNRLGDLYMQMTPEEKAKQKFSLTPKKYGPYKANPPSKEQFESFKDPKMYGVWLDGKRVPNSVLSKYQHTDFADFWQSTLLKNAAHYGQYKYHLELSTPAAFQAYVNETKKDTSRYLIGYRLETVKQIRAITR